MANFKEFRALIQKHFNEMVKDDAPLFITNADEDKLYDLYLDSFPAGTNSIFRKRREYDCSCCRRFVKNIGKLVSFMDGYRLGFRYQVRCLSAGCGCAGCLCENLRCCESVLRQPQYDL